MQLFCFGYGYVAQHLAAALKTQNIPVTGTARSAEKAAAIDGFVMDSTTPLDAKGQAALTKATHVLISIPPESDGMDAAFRHHAELLKSKKWIGYLSTTGVYGDYDGKWVDESSAMLATEPRSQRRIEAERRWLTRHAHIFRLAGIYGEQRNAIEQVLRGEARRVYKEGQFFSRIHVEDIVQVLLASVQKPSPAAIYNLCDDEPAPSHEVIAYACALLEQEPPPLIPYEQADLSPMAQSFYAANRRVKNDKIKKSLGVSLHYPSYRQGLASILQGKARV